MKKAILTLAITAVITVSILSFIQPSTSGKVSFMKNDAAAKAELYNTLEDSLQQFNKESETKIGKYEASISEYKTRIINEQRENKDRATKKLVELTK